MELSRAEHTILEGHSVILAARADVVRTAIQNYNDTILDAYEEVGGSLQDYNEAASDAREVIREVVRSLRERWSVGTRRGGCRARVMRCSSESAGGVM